MTLAYEPFSDRPNFQEFDAAFANDPGAHMQAMDQWFSNPQNVASFVQPRNAYSGGYGTNPMQNYSNVGTAPDQLARLSRGTLREDGTLGFKDDEFDAGLRESKWGLPGGIEFDTHDLARAGIAAGAAAGATGLLGGGGAAATQGAAPAALSEVALPASAVPLAAPGVPITAIGTGGATAGPAASGAGGLLKGFAKKAGSWIGKNKDLVGNVVAGIGDRMAQKEAADLERELLQMRMQGERDLLSHRQELTSANYRGADPNRSFRGLMPTVGAPAPADRFNPKSYGSFTYEYDPQKGRIVKVPAE